MSDRPVGIDMISDLSKKRVLNVSEAARYSGYNRGWIEAWLRKGGKG